MGAVLLAGYAASGKERVRILDLHPTQFVVGMIVVHEHQAYFESLTEEELDGYLKQHPAEKSVRGPGGGIFITDRHNHTLAAWLAGADYAYVKIEHDWSNLNWRRFWKKMKQHGYLDLFDEHGVARVREDLPTRLPDLKDDIYRSLAGKVRDAGAYDKSSKPFAENEWARHFRRHIPIERVRENFSQCVVEAGRMAHFPRAEGNRGYQPPPRKCTRFYERAADLN